MAKKRGRISDSQMTVLNLLWDHGPLTARAIADAIYKDASDTEFAAVHSFLQRLERKGLVERDRSSFVHVFSPVASREDVVGQEFEALADRMADGSIAPLILHLVRKQRLTPDEADEIRRLLEDYPRRKRRGR